MARIMRQNGIVGKVRRRYRVTTQAGDRAPAKSLLNRDFKASEPNRKWVSDITYIPTREGWLYLAVIIDLYSRAVVGWSMNSWISQELVLDALKMAVGRRRVPRALSCTRIKADNTPAWRFSESQRSPDGVLDEPQGPAGTMRWPRASLPPSRENWRPVIEALTLVSSPQRAVRTSSFGLDAGLPEPS